MPIDYSEVDNNPDLLTTQDTLDQQDDSSETPPADIVAFNEQRSCADIYRMYKSGQLKIDPDFQRNSVWKISDRSRFIDSLSKQLPIPSMCISLDYKTNERLVIDGLQRISTIINFLDGGDWKLSKLEDLDPKIANKSPNQIRKVNPDIFSKIENVMIPITVLRCDYSKKSHMQYLFTIFHRLNSGGSKLNNQEIRNCIYNGEFNNLLKRLANDEKSQSFFNYSTVVTNAIERTNYRFQFEELYLRVFAFVHRLENYNGKLSSFLNNFMDDNKDLDEETIEAWYDNMQKTLDIIYQDPRISGFSKTIIESILYGVYQNRDNSSLKDTESFAQRINTLRNNDLFSLINLKEGLASKEKVTGRLSLSKAIFGGTDVE